MVKHSFFQLQIFLAFTTGFLYVTTNVSSSFQLRCCKLFQVAHLFLEASEVASYRSCLLSSLPFEVNVAHVCVCTLLIVKGDSLKLDHYSLIASLVLNVG